RSSTRNRPSPSTWATTMWMELLPTSIAATRMLECASTAAHTTTSSLPDSTCGPLRQDVTVRAGRSAFASWRIDDGARASADRTGAAPAALDLAAEISRRRRGRSLAAVEVDRVEAAVRNAEPTRGVDHHAERVVEVVDQLRCVGGPVLDPRCRPGARSGEADQ